MPRKLIHPRPERKPNRDFKKIRPKPHNPVPAPNIPQKLNISEQGGISDRTELFSQVPSGGSSSLSNLNPSRSGSVTHNLQPLRDDGTTTSYPTEIEEIYQEEMITKAPKSLPTRLSGYPLYAVEVISEFGTQPLLVAFNSKSEYSCMPAKYVTGTIEVKLRFTTPAQRQRWYPTPAGQIHEPQRYAELNLRAFDPYIPTIKLTVLLLEGDGPIDGVHIYLGRSVFTKLAEMGIQLNVREIHLQDDQSDVNDLNMKQHGKFAEVPAAPGSVSAVSSNRDPGPFSIMSRFGTMPPPTVRSSGVLSSNFDMQDAMSAMTPLFSEAPSCPSTVTSCESAHAPLNSMAGFMKYPADDAFTGYFDADSISSEDARELNTIDPAVLLDLSQDNEKIWSEVSRNAL